MKGGCFGCRNDEKWNLDLDDLCYWITVVFSPNGPSFVPSDSKMNQPPSLLPQFSFLFQIQSSSSSLPPLPILQPWYVNKQRRIHSSPLRLFQGARSALFPFLPRNPRIHVIRDILRIHRCPCKHRMLPIRLRLPSTPPPKTHDHINGLRDVVGLSLQNHRAVLLPNILLQPRGQPREHAGSPREQDVLIELR